MLEIIKTDALINNVNPRAENHGDETALACDIALTFTVSNQMLNRIDRGLLTALYQKEPLGAEATQEHMDLEDGFLPHVRFPQLGNIPWTYEGAGYTFKLFSDRENYLLMSIADCKVNKMRIEAQEGGTIKLSLRVQGRPDEDDIGTLCHFIKSEAQVSLIAPAASAAGVAGQSEIDMSEDPANQEGGESESDDET